ncbi:hypothetical protein [uncultured Brachyspira sp.]|uniref:hypothetical protein n=1 Tax=uncultured Brachyspira sp. TaxID=221953 RepID=UPI00261A4395|nr:hypothetical protein [uncultured Brachyspira sp.]
MNKKLLTIFLSLFLVGILSISCSNEDKTAPKGIEQYNGNSYVSVESYTVPQGTGYLWVSVKDSKVRMNASSDQTSEPSYQGYMDVTGSGTDYSFSTDYYGQPNGIEGTLKFAPDGSTVTVNYSKNLEMPSIEGQDIVCNKR